MIVAPYYGVGGGKTASWNENFVTRIRRCEYPQYMWDQLPIPNSQGSVLRLDQLQPIGRQGQAFELTPYRLCSEALVILDDWLDWILKGLLDEESFLLDFRREMLKTA